MKLFIPPLGTCFRLAKPWKFKLHYEKRNRSLWDLAFSLPWDSLAHLRQGSVQPFDFTLYEANLTIDRIYVRQGMDSHSSVTFKGEVPSMGVIRKVRFWVSLEDANKIEGDIIS